MIILVVVQCNITNHEQYNITSCMIFDVSRMPHWRIGWTTLSGVSPCDAAMVHLSPAECESRHVGGIEQQRRHLLWASRKTLRMVLLLSNGGGRWEESGGVGGGFLDCLLDDDSPFAKLIARRVSQRGCACLCPLLSFPLARRFTREARHKSKSLFRGKLENFSRVREGGWSHFALTGHNHTQANTHFDVPLPSSPPPPTLLHLFY